jgi:ketosteroid isomerase-like protein
MPRRVSIFVFALLLAGCTTGPADTSAAVTAVNDLARKEIAAFSAMDTAALNTLFAENVVAMPPNEPAIQGRAALIAWAQALGAQFTVNGEYGTLDTTVSGDLAVQRFTGRLTMTPKAGGSSISETIKGVHVLRRQANGAWLITEDVWNSDQPAAPAAPPSPATPAAGGSD